MSNHSDDDQIQLSSPPCAMHEVDPAYMGLPENNPDLLSEDAKSHMANAPLQRLPDAIVLADRKGTGMGTIA